MRNSLSLILGAAVTIDDLPALRLSPDSQPALPLISGPRLAVIGRIAPRIRCSDCSDFEAVTTRHGIVTCPSPAHAREQLPIRPQPHERDGRQDPPTTPARPHSRFAAQLAG